MSWVLLILTILPQVEPVVDRCDVIEVNHFYDWEGRLVFDQLIFWEWNPLWCRDDVLDWRLLNKCPGGLPESDHRHGGWTSTFYDEQAGIIRTVRAKSVRETWTQEDPEAIERQICPASQRRGLTKVKFKIFP